MFNHFHEKEVKSHEPKISYFKLAIDRENRKRHAQNSKYTGLNYMITCA